MNSTVYTVHSVWGWLIDWVNKELKKMEELRSTVLYAQEELTHFI